MTIIVTGAGRIGKDAEIRRTQAGESVTGFSLAMDSGFGKGKVTHWFGCSLWGKRGESVAPYLPKGSQVSVCGEYGEREHNGKTYKTLRIHTLDLVGGKPEGQRQEAQGHAPATSTHGTRQPPAADDFADDDIPF